ncbi:MAG TPA: hypothetical protein V6C90_28820 [Coleofasciculaceae cyanobacterium]
MPFSIAFLELNSYLDFTREAIATASTVRRVRQELRYLRRAAPTQDVNMFPPGRGFPDAVPDVLPN